MPGEELGCAVDMISATTQRAPPGGPEAAAGVQVRGGRDRAESGWQRGLPSFCLPFQTFFLLSWLLSLKDPNVTTPWSLPSDNTYWSSQGGLEGEGSD